MNMSLKHTVANEPHVIYAPSFSLRLKSEELSFSILFSDGAQTKTETSKGPYFKLSGVFFFSPTLVSLLDARQEPSEKC